MADPCLAALVRAVEAGAAGPRIWMTLTSGDLVIVVPRPSREFATGTQAPLQRRYYEGNLRLPVKNNAERSVAASERATADTKLLGDGLGGSDEPEAMTLAEVRVLFGGRKDGANIPVVRVNLDAVSLWWVAGEQEFRGDDGGFLLGVGFPI